MIIDILVLIKIDKKAEGNLNTCITKSPFHIQFIIY